MQRLLYTDITGLNEVKHIPKMLAPGAYVRDLFGCRVLIRQRNRIVWKEVNKVDLPKELLLEALVLNITL